MDKDSFRLMNANASRLSLLFWPGLASVLMALVVVLAWHSFGGASSSQAKAATPVLVPAAPMVAAIDHERAFANAIATRLADIRDTTGELRRGDALQDVIRRAGTASSEAASAAYQLSQVFDARLLQAGQKVELALRPAADGAMQLVGLVMKPDPERSVYMRRTANGEFRIQEHKSELIPVAKRVTGEIEGSLYMSARAYGASNAILSDVVKLLAYSVDFQREIYAGDPFEIFYTEYQDMNGETLRTGALHYVRLESSKRNIEFWRHTHADGETVGYYDAEGEAAERLLMKTPVDGARLSSNFGKRRHPILGYARMHRGVDFAAPRGTPIYAAGHGTVLRANRFGSFGNYIRIRHASGYETAYAHLNRIRVRKGQKVRQGQVIGTVGTTGRSTGPHLHYEVHHKGKAVNPMTLPDLGGEKLNDGEHQRYKVERALINALRLKASEPRETGGFSAL